MNVFLILLLSLSILPVFAEDHSDGNLDTITEFDDVNIENIMDASIPAWEIYTCNEVSCDLSNWFAELLFGILIGVGLLIWQILRQKNRASYFVGHIYAKMFPIVSALYYLKEHEFLKKNINTELSENEQSVIVEEFNRIKEERIELQKRVDASGELISGKLQEHVQQLIDHLDFDLSKMGKDKSIISYEIDMMFEDSIEVIRHNKKQYKKELYIHLDHSVEQKNKTHDIKLIEYFDKRIYEVSEILHAVDEVGETKSYFQRPSAI